MHRISEYGLKNLPIDLTAGFSEGAAVDLASASGQRPLRLAFRKKSPDFISSFTFSAGSNREYKGDELREGKLVVAGKIFGGLFL